MRNEIKKVIDESNSQATGILAQAEKMRQASVIALFVEKRQLKLYIKLKLKWRETYKKDHFQVGEDEGLLEAGGIRLDDSDSSIAQLVGII